MPGRFIALEGIDGIGKTALAQQLADLEYSAVINEASVRPVTDFGAEPQLVFVSRRQVSATSSYANSVMIHLATVLWHSGDSQDLSDAFWVHLQAGWFIAHSQSVLDPLLESGFDVLVDGWLYKFFSKLLVQGYSHSQIETIFATVRMPESVVLLEADVAATYDRRGIFRPTELGLHAGYGAVEDLGRGTFVDYQTRAANNLADFAAQNGWLRAHVGNDEPVLQTVQRLLPMIATARGR